MDRRSFFAGLLSLLFGGFFAKPVRRRQHNGRIRLMRISEAIGYVKWKDLEGSVTEKFSADQQTKTSAVGTLISLEIFPDGGVMPLYVTEMFGKDGTPFLCYASQYMPRDIYLAMAEKSGWPKFCLVGSTAVS